MATMPRTLLSIAAALTLACCLPGCGTPTANGITQVATIDALLAGVYDGHMTLGALREYGDLGIGTFEGLDGEMTLVDGTFYKVRADGKVYRPPLSERTPFASVTRFVPDLKDTLSGPADRKALEARIDALAPSRNQICAFIVRGDFRLVRTRSVPAQKKPYPPLVEVTKTQPVFTLRNVRGTLVGFRLPDFVKGVNVPGYHMHFLTDDRTGGGHVLGFELAQGTLEADRVHEWLDIRLPTGSSSFGAANLTQDRTAELQAAEKDR